MQRSGGHDLAAVNAIGRNSDPAIGPHHEWIEISHASLVDHTMVAKELKDKFVNSLTIITLIRSFVFLLFVEIKFDFFELGKLE